VNVSDYRYNVEKIEAMIEDGIKNAIRDMIPEDDLLGACLNNKVSNSQPAQKDKTTVNAEESDSDESSAPRSVSSHGGDSDGSDDEDENEVKYTGRNQFGQGGAGATQAFAPPVLASPMPPVPPAPPAPHVQAQEPVGGNIHASFQEAHGGVDMTPTSTANGIADTATPTSGSMECLIESDSDDE